MDQGSALKILNENKPQISNIRSNGLRSEKWKPLETCIRKLLLKFSLKYEYRSNAYFSTFILLLTK